MGPRSVERGKAVVPRGVRTRGWLQWGRVLLNAERRDAKIYSRVAGSFNGAAFC